MSAEAIAVVGAAVGLLAVLVPLMLFLHGRLADRIETVNRTLTERIDAVNGALTDRIDTVNGTLADRMEAMHGTLTERIDTVNGTLADRMEAMHESLSGDLAEVRRDLRDLGERVARIRRRVDRPLAPARERTAGGARVRRGDGPPDVMACRSVDVGPVVTRRSRRRRRPVGRPAARCRALR